MLFAKGETGLQTYEGERPGKVSTAGESGLSWRENNSLKLVDLVFFRAPESVLEEYYKYGAYLGISHVGIGGGR